MIPTIREASRPSRNIIINSFIVCLLYIFTRVKVLFEVSIDSINRITL
jgi:hypothetical protein